MNNNDLLVTSKKKSVPRMVSFLQAEKEGSPLSAYTLRRMYREGTLPTRTIKSGNRVLLNLDLLIENLNTVR